MRFNFLLKLTFKIYAFFLQGCVKVGKRRCVSFLNSALPQAQLCYKCTYCIVVNQIKHALRKFIIQTEKAEYNICLGIVIFLYVLFINTMTRSFTPPCKSFAPPNLRTPAPVYSNLQALAARYVRLLITGQPASPTHFRDYNGKFV